MKKIFYATSLFYPSQYANRLQTLQTAEALAKKLGDSFILGCDSLSGAEGLYTHAHVNFFSRRSPVLAFKQLRYLRKNGISFVYSREYSILFMMCTYNMLFFRMPLTYVLEVHDVYKDFRFSFMLRRCAHIFCLTKGLAADVRRLFQVSVPITLLPDGVNLHDFAIEEDRQNLRKKYGLSGEEYVVSYVGSVGVHAWKGVDVFLESLMYVQNPSVQYVVVGVRDQDLEMFKTQYPQTQVSFFGWQNRREVAELMRLSNALVLPNKRGPVVSERYTSPMKLFEYMASGIPIIASDLPSTREVIDEKSAFLVSPNDPKALAEAVDRICSDSNDALTRARVAAQIVQKYSWDDRAATIITNISSLV